jgi:hypothetical protein
VHIVLFLISMQASPRLSDRAINQWLSLQTAHRLSI